MTAVPDEESLFGADPARLFTGTVLVEDWQGNFVKGFRYSQHSIEPLSPPQVVNLILSNYINSLFIIHSIPQPNFLCKNEGSDYQKLTYIFMKHIFSFQIIGFIALPLCVSCINFKENKQEHNKVVFVNEGYREYGWKEYDKDSIQFRKPMRVILDLYTVEYHLNNRGLIIYKVKKNKNYVTRKVMYKQTLNREQMREFKKLFTEIKLDSISHVSSSLGVDDGFGVNVIISKNKQKKEIYWSNMYVPDLVKLLSIVNRLSPKKYKFYVNEEQFIEELKKLSPKESRFR